MSEVEGAVPGTVKEWFESSGYYADLKFPPGPWDGEPSKLQWVDARTGLPCLIVRTHMGALCGYAGVYPGHPLYGKNWPVPLDAHGGVNHSGACQHSDDPAQGVCHIPEPGTSDEVWWFGFDCGHVGTDKVPGLVALEEVLQFPERGILIEGIYRDIAYVTAEVRDLAAQLKEIR